MSQKAEVADLGKAARQHVQEKPPDKLFGTNRKYFFFIIVTAVAIAEPENAGLIDSENPFVGDGHPVGIATKILEYLLRSAERLLGIGDPLFVP